KDTASVAKLKVSISAKEKEIKDSYTEIGKAYYEAHKDAQEDVYDSFIALINAKNEEIAAINEEISEIQANSADDVDITDTVDNAQTDGETSGDAEPKTEEEQAADELSDAAKAAADAVADAAKDDAE
ncbi:MAG: hypothetical protein LUG56_03410, partial [Lachnospiraceae bacterium]|nr:hypothetical protein [Lachnospiraceae bacterium]